MKLTNLSCSLILSPSRPATKRCAAVGLRTDAGIPKMSVPPNFFKPLILLLLASSLLWQADASMPNFGKSEAAQEGTANQEESAAGLSMRGVVRSKIGPWGQLEYFEALLEAPLELVKASQPTSIRTRWFFGKMPPDDVASFLQTLKLPQDLESQLSDHDRWIQSPEGTTIYPKTSTILALPPQIRTTLYRTLARWPENGYHAEPEFIYGESVKEWLAGIDVSQEVVEFIEKTSYATVSARLFADTPAALALASSEKERISILRAFSRTPTLVAKVRIKEGNPQELRDYWNKGTRFKDTSTFLNSMLRYDDFEKIDLVHLLPAEVRKILYTFPRPSQTRSGYLPDCHWSSLNFFNTQPIERLSDPPQATAYTLENFERVSPPYELGDVLFFTDLNTGDAYHSCAYIADDIVFTKNGRSPLQPWVLMNVNKVKDLYDLHYRTNTTAYRRKFQP